MALNFAAVLALVRSRLDESAASVWTDAELQDYIFLAENMLLSLVSPDALYDITVETITQDTVPNGYVTIPATVLKPARVFVNDEPAPIIVPGKQTAYVRLKDDGTTVYPTAWFAGGKVYYSPSVANDNIKVLHIPKPTEGSILVPDRFIDIVISKTYALAIEREDLNKARVADQVFAAMIQATNAVYTDNYNLSPPKEMLR